MAHREGNYVPQTRHYMPHHVFGHNSLNNLLLFFQPQNIEEQLSLIELYLVLNDFNSVENLIEQIYDDIKHIDQFVIEEGELGLTNSNNNTNNNSIKTNDDNDNSSNTNSTSTSNPTNNNTNGTTSPSSHPQTNKVIIKSKREELQERVYALRQMLKNNSVLVRTLKISAYNAKALGEGGGTGIPLVKPEPLPPKEERLAMKKQQQQNGQTAQAGQQRR